MSKEVKPSDGDYKWLRSLWIGVTIFFGFALVFNFIQWVRGAERLNAILVPAVFVLMGLNHTLKFKGMVQKVLLALMVVLGILILLNLFIR